MKKKEITPIALCTIAGVGLFFFRFGVIPGIFMPTNINWILGQGGDIMVHFAGWHFFRYESWHFPLGYINNYLAPFGTSIGLTDSLPLLGLPLKIFSFLLPQEFQYFGFWILVNHILQGIFGYLLLTTRVKDKTILFAGTFFFLISPIFLRKFLHIALGSHWLILASLWLYFFTNTQH